MTMTMINPEIEPMVAFTAHDRCDRCGAQALAVARKEGHTELMFCWHHKEEFENPLIDTGWTVIADHASYESYRAPLDVSVPN